MQALLLSGWLLLGQVAAEGPTEGGPDSAIPVPAGSTAPLGPTNPAPAASLLDDDSLPAPSGDRFGASVEGASAPPASKTGGQGATTLPPPEVTPTTPPPATAPSRPSDNATGGPATPRWRDKHDPASPAGSAADLVPVRRSRATAQVKGVVQRALAVGSGGGELTGRPLTLLEAFRTASHPAARTDVAKAYWTLATAAGSYYRAADDRHRLEQFATRMPAADDVQRAVVEAAVTSAEAAAREARYEAVAAQHSLAELIGAGTSLPLATDLPHTGAYRTSFEAIFSLRPAPSEARKLHHLLPLRQQALAARADAVVAAEQATAAMQAEYLAGRDSLSAALAQQQRRTAHWQALLEQVRRYNNEIAEYVSMAGGQGASNEALVTMLIDVPVPEAVARPEPAELTTALPPAGDPRRQGQPTLAEPEPTSANKPSP